MIARAAVVLAAIGFAMALGAAGCSSGGCASLGACGPATGGSGTGSGSGSGSGSGTDGATCSAMTGCAIGSGTYKACSVAGGSGCASSYFLTSSGTKYSCNSCSDCTAAAQSVVGWCQGNSGRQALDGTDADAVQLTASDAYALAFSR